MFTLVHNTDAVYVCLNLYQVSRYTQFLLAFPLDGFNGSDYVFLQRSVQFAGDNDTSTYRE